MRSAAGPLPSTTPRPVPPGDALEGLPYQDTFFARGTNLKCRFLHYRPCSIRVFDWNAEQQRYVMVPYRKATARQHAHGTVLQALNGFRFLSRHRSIVDNASSSWGSSSSFDVSFRNSISSISCTFSWPARPEQYIVAER